MIKLQPKQRRLTLRLVGGEQKTCKETEKSRRAQRLFASTQTQEISENLWRSLPFRVAVALAPWNPERRRCWWRRIFRSTTCALSSRTFLWFVEWLRYFMMARRVENSQTNSRKAGFVQAETGRTKFTVLTGRLGKDTKGLSRLCSTLLFFLITSCSTKPPTPNCGENYNKVLKQWRLCELSLEVCMSGKQTMRMREGI